MSLEATLITDLLKKYLSLLIEDYDASFLHSSLLQGKLKLDEFKINCHNLNALNKDGAFTGIDVDSLELDVSLQHRQPFVSAKLQSLTLAGFQGKLKNSKIKIVVWIHGHFLIRKQRFF